MAIPLDFNNKNNSYFASGCFLLLAALAACGGGGAGEPENGNTDVPGVATVTQPVFASNTELLVDFNHPGQKRTWSSIDAEDHLLVIGNSGPDTLGAAYVFRYANDIWSAQELITASDGYVGQRFGVSVDVDGDTLVVGAPADNEQTGAVYVFRWDGSVWIETQKIEPATIEPDARYGSSVALNGNKLAVASLGNAVYVYEFDTDLGAWVSVAQVPATRPTFWGNRVLYDGEVLVVGSYRDFEVYRIEGGAVRFVEAIETGRGNLSLALDDNIIVAGNTLGKNQYGTFFVYSGTAWVYEYKDGAVELVETFAGGGPNAGLGAAVAVEAESGRVFASATASDQIRQYLKSQRNDDWFFLPWLYPQNTTIGVGARLVISGNHLFATAWEASSVHIFKLDEDGDGISDAIRDSDSDGLVDIFETNTGIYRNRTDWGSDPTQVDTDGDGLEDVFENGSNIYINAKNTGTSPINADSDGDGLLDGYETGTGVFVSNQDAGTLPLKSDTDSDGFVDGVESATGFFESLSRTGTDPNKFDTDGDTSSDYEEVVLYGTDPFDSSDYR